MGADPERRHLAFTAADLGRVRLQTRVHPWWETVLLVRHWESHRANLPEEVRACAAEPSTREAATVLRCLLSAQADLPGFLAVCPSEVPTPDALESLDLDRVAADIVRSAPGHPFWSAALDSGRLRSELRYVGTLISHCYDRIVRQLLASIESEVAAAVASLSYLMVTEGVSAALASLPGVRTDAAGLSLPDRRGDHRELGGQGLLVLPARFATRPLLHHAEGRSAVLVVPATGTGQPSRACVLDDLLGATKNEILLLLRPGAQTTTELAIRIGVTKAAVSQHLRRLRVLGLVITTTSSGRRLHHLTGRGRVMLTA
jgi:DNA-binding transcriptional ArsR family regulator